MYDYYSRFTTYTNNAFPAALSRVPQSRRRDEIMSSCHLSFSSRHDRGLRQFNLKVHTTSITINSIAFLIPYSFLTDVKIILSANIYAPFAGSTWTLCGSQCASMRWWELRRCYYLVLLATLSSCVGRDAAYESTLERRVQDTPGNECTGTGTTCKCAHNPKRLSITRMS